MAIVSSKAVFKVKSSEARSHERIPVEVILSYNTVDQFCCDIATNISLGGIFIKTHAPLPVGTTLRISFHVPQLESRVEASGVVTHSSAGETSGMGIKFAEIDSRAVRTIDELIKYNLDLLEATGNTGEKIKTAKKALKKPAAKTKDPATKKTKETEVKSPKKPAVKTGTKPASKKLKNKPD